MALKISDRVRETTTTTGTGTITLAGAVTGYVSFASVLADQDTTLYCIASQGGSLWETGIGTFTASGTTLARTTVLANSSGTTSAISLTAGTYDVFITLPEERLPLPELTTDPAAPASGCYFYTRKLAGRFVPRFIGPSGLDSAVQPGLFGNSITMWLPGTGSTAAINFGTSWTITGTQSHPTIASTSFVTQMRRAQFTTTTLSTGSCGVRSAAPVCWRGNAAGQGGFFFAARFALEAIHTGIQVLVGLSGLTTAITGDPSAVNDTCGLSKDTADTVWQMLTRDTTTANKVTTGRTVAAATNADIYDFYMSCFPNASSISFRLVDVATGTVIVDNVSTSTHLPTNTTMLTVHADCRGGSTASPAPILSLNKIYLESDT